MRKKGKGRHVAITLIACSEIIINSLHGEEHVTREPSESHLPFSSY